MNHQETYGSKSNNQKHKCKKIKHKQNATNNKTDNTMCMINLVMSYEEIDYTIEKYNIHQ